MKAYQDIMLKEHQATVTAAKGGEVSADCERVVFRDTDQIPNGDGSKPESMFEALFDRSYDEDDLKRRQSAPPRVVSERARVRIDVPVRRKPKNQTDELFVNDKDIKSAFETLKKSRTSNIRTCKFDSRESVCGEGGKLEHQLQAMHKRRQKAITVYINKQAKASGNTTPKSMVSRSSLNNAAHMNSGSS